MCLGFDYFSGYGLALHYLMSTLFFFLKKKKFFLVYFNTNNFEIFSCQPCVTCVSHVEFLNFFFGSSHVLTFNFNFNSNRHAWMWNESWYAWLNFSFPYSNLFCYLLVFILLVRWKQVFKRADLLAVSLAKTCSFATTCWYPPACFGNSFLGFYHVS